MAKKDHPKADAANSPQPDPQPTEGLFISTHTPESAEAPNAGSPVAGTVLTPTAADDSALAVGADTEPLPVDETIAQRDDAADAADAAAAEAAANSGKAARGEEIDFPDWQKPDYSGPLNIEQAEWRNTRLRRK